MPRISISTSKRRLPAGFAVGKVCAWTGVATMVPDDLIRLGRLHAHAFRSEGEPDKAAVSEAIVADVKHLDEHGSTAFGRRFSDLRSDLHRHGRSLPSTAFWSAYRASTF